MTPEAHELFSTRDGRLAMGEAEGWVLTIVADMDGQVTQKARLPLAELVTNVRVLEILPAARADGESGPVEIILGFTPDGYQLCAAVTEDLMAIMEVSSDGVSRRLLCGPYLVEEAQRMADAVVKASAE